ncbi:molybdenum cofactor guanylyltransferase [Faecalicatena contorta]|uniref:Probable molybdenum cofactor guanylyltransferase n=1 Tax=Faecalicatena contorta TaxID=39482 RepID=A0A315ZSU0_9FIRM|nr:molybdenum cofactor guanylyltransferase [Faecalicatena contorta]PWJ47958.1 molybdenum cofactor guanylyltransferase [Faecalicatena contorta]SUQ15721.1 molybdenum cofactor guanylyltransferase [Faecalicatena contorta]
MSEKIKNVTAAVLCGGKSRRMGFDKAFLMDEEQYLLLQTVRELQILFEQVVLVSNTKAKFEDRTGFREIPILEDFYIEKGPIGGISTALQEVQTEYIFAMACDMPLPDVSLIGRMYRKLGRKQVLVCSHEGKLEPLFAFYHKSCLPAFEEQIRKNELRPRSAFSSLEVEMYHLSGEEKRSIVNLNTPGDVQKWNEKTAKNERD